MCAIAKSDGVSSFCGQSAIMSEVAPARRSSDEDGLAKSEAFGDGWETEAKSEDVLATAGKRKLSRCIVLPLPCIKEKENHGLYLCHVHLHFEKGPYTRY